MKIEWDNGKLSIDGKIRPECEGIKGKGNLSLKPNTFFGQNDDGNSEDGDMDQDFIIIGK